MMMGLSDQFEIKPLKIRAQRWSKLKQYKHKSLVIYITWKVLCLPSIYIYSSKYRRAKVYTALGGAPVDIFASEILMNAMTWLDISSPTLLSFISESKSRAISYNPQRVL